MDAADVVARPNDAAVRNCLPQYRSLRKAKQAAAWLQISFS